VILLLVSVCLSVCVSVGLTYSSLTLLSTVILLLVSLFVCLSVYLYACLSVSVGLTYSSLTLLSTVILLLVLTHINRWRLTRLYGAVLSIIYVLFNILSCLYELNVFAYVHPPECPSQY